MRCQAKRADGTPCRADAHPGKRFCCFHRPELARKRAAGRAKGAANSHKSARADTLPEDTPDLPLRSVADVINLLGDTVNRVRTGRIGVNVANSIGQLAGMLLKGLQAGELEQRIEALEARGKR